MIIACALLTQEVGKWGYMNNNMLSLGREKAVGEALERSTAGEKNARSPVGYRRSGHGPTNSNIK